MAYNVLYDAPDPKASVKLIEEIDPDVVCLREVRPPFMKALKRIDAKYPYRVVRTKASGTWGAVVLSKHRIARHSIFETRPQRMPGLDVTIDIDAHGELRLACLHLMPPGAKHRKSDTLLGVLEKNATIRRQQAEHVVKRFASHRGPMLLLGDFNEETGDATNRLADAGFVDACSAGYSRCSATWPGATSDWPAIVRIDKVLGRNVDFAWSRVPSGGGSDHQPIVAVLIPDPASRGR